MTIEELIRTAGDAGGSDLHLVKGLPPRFRRDGRLEDMDGEMLTDTDCEGFARELAGEAYEQIREIGELDLAGTFAGIRVRINLFRQQGHISAAIRLLSGRIPELDSLGLPPAVSRFPSMKRGLILVTGETGSGKSTTLAAILNEINRTRKGHIITLEDPVEYIYPPDQCVVNQRQIGTDTRSYGDGLRAALREDPDVILIGELRDLDTIETALTAAETGHLVFGALHTNSAADSIDRIVNVFPDGLQRQIRLQLSTSLLAVLSQQLVERKNGKGRVAACELMMVTPAIRNLIREAKTPQIASSMASAAQEGSITMDNFLVRLYKDQVISARTAKEAARDLDYMKRYVLV